MAGYLIVNIKSISDPEKIQQYRQKAWPTIEQYGGESLVTPRGRHEYAEGHVGVGMVIYRFSSYEQAEKWYHSPEYSEAKKLREAIADVSVVIAEGQD